MFYSDFLPSRYSLQQSRSLKNAFVLLFQETCQIKTEEQIFLKQPKSWDFLWDHIELILKCNHAKSLQTLTLCLHFAAGQEEWTETFIDTYRHKVIARWLFVFFFPWLIPHKIPSQIVICKS